MHDEIQFKTEVDCGFNLPIAYQASRRRYDHMIAIASLIASVFVVSTVGAQIILG
ncbi:hypothetical protein [Ochrobactrum chromiisoli]|uniref:Uncharacterized protein n=1 Tax=Ochrobactrum chromiisoli TaxID=2993941 RepID=A0ABT3QL75_9HYPH|nr:hypothetical protein [Ochrobactrum chromiisoli]MCX2696368.1 hypothetical protein [Ochrobactrum chromiisoli]